jgi:hypothetical protein
MHRCFCQSGRWKRSGIAPVIAHGASYGTGAVDTYASCPVGYVLSGGGGNCDGFPSAAALDYDHPIDTATWHTACTNNEGYSGWANAYAICLAN